MLSRKVVVSDPPNMRLRTSTVEYHSTFDLTQIDNVPVYPIRLLREEKEGYHRYSLRRT